MPNGENSFHLNDPSTYQERQGGFPSNYSYQVRVDYTTTLGTARSQFITVRSNDVLTEDQINATAEAIMLSATNKYKTDSIENIDITGAQRKA